VVLCVFVVVSFFLLIFLFSVLGFLL